MHTFNSPMIRAQVDVVKYGAAQKQFNVSHAVDFWFAVPPKEEQRQIVEHLARVLEVPSDAIANAEREIALIREYRTRLVADVVTGKLNVRAAAERVPDDEASAAAGDLPEALEETAGADAEAIEEDSAEVMETAE